MADEKDDKTRLKDLALSRLRDCKKDMDYLQTWSATMFDKYMGNPYGNERDGCSQVVMTDISDTIEWIMPALMKIFYGGKDVVQLRPQGPEDEENVKLMEEKVNFDIQKSNNGFLILYSWFKDALLLKRGVVKYRWERTDKKIKKEYKGLTQGELDSLTASGSFEVIDITPSEKSRETVFNGVMDEEVITYEYNVKGNEIRKSSVPVFEVLPPEEAILDLKSKNIETAKIFAHRKLVTDAGLRKYGKTAQDINAEVTNFENDSTYANRFKDLGGLSFIKPDKERDEFYLYECFLDDHDEDGTPIPKKIVIVGDEALELEDNTYGKTPVCILSPIIVPHRIVGRSISELIDDLQLLRTSLMRYILDNIYFQNNGMKVVNPYRINIDDLINGNRPGGLVRTRGDYDVNTSLYPIPINPLPPHIMNIVEYVDTIRENKTGITKYNQGLDASSLNKTASGISQIMSAAQQRLELIARIFAETGVKDLFQADVDMNMKFFDVEQFIKINDQWQMIRPENISGQYDVIIDVGVGTGSKEMVFNQLTNMLNVYSGVMNVVMKDPRYNVVSPDNIYNILKEMWQMQGWKNTDRFVTPPNQMTMPPVPPPNPLMEQGGATPPNPLMNGGIPIA